MIVTPLTMCICFSMFLIAKVKRNHRQLEIKLLHLSNIMVLHFQYKGSDFFSDLQMPFSASIFPLIILFIYFYMGQKFHSNSMNLSDAIYQTEWHRYPRSVRRFVLLIILRSQKPFYLSSYGILKLNLKNFVGVSEAI